MSDVYDYKPGQILVAIDDWKGAGNGVLPVCFGARVLFAKDATGFLRTLSEAGAAGWHASGPRKDVGFLFSSTRFDEVLRYLDSEPTRYYGMLQRVDELLTPAIRRQADELRQRHPHLAPVLPNNPYGLGLHWFLERLVPRLLDEFGSDRPVRVFIDALDWDGERRSQTQDAVLPYGASSQHDVEVFTVVRSTDSRVADAAALLGLVDSELWAFGRFQSLQLPDGSTLRHRMLQWQERPHDDPIISRDELARMLVPHKDHRQLRVFWEHLPVWLGKGRTEVIRESTQDADKPQTAQGHPTGA